MRLGAHIGVAGGIDKSPALGRKIGCEAIQIFAKSPYMWKGAPLEDAVADGFRAANRSEGLVGNAVHHGYLLNLATPKAGPRKQSKAAFLDELGRAEKLGADFLIFHPGAHLKSGVDAGIDELVKALDESFEATDGYHVRALLENSAGQGTTLCSRFEELGEILRRLKTPKRAGVALDTCHLFASGFDFRTPDGYEGVIAAIEASFGVDAVRAFHLNDAKMPLGSHRDRHENIGKGTIGADGFGPLVRDRRWADRPGFLETPLDDHEYDAYVRDLATLRAQRDGTPAATPAATPRRKAAPRAKTPK